MVGGTTHCVCKKGTIRPQGSPRCVPEPLLQQYLNNIIGNCTEIQKDLIEVYGPKVSFSSETSRRTYARKEQECDPNAKNPCKGLPQSTYLETAKNKQLMQKTFFFFLTNSKNTGGLEKPCFVEC